MTKPGVGYEVRPGTRSLAGNSHVPPEAPYTMDLTADPWAGRDPRTNVVDQEAMKQRYGPFFQAGVSGPHSNVYEDALREKFATRTAFWNPKYEDFDGNPIGREVNDAFYSRDTKVTAPVIVTGTCEEKLAKAQHDLDACKQQVAELTAQVQQLNTRVQKLKEVPPDISGTVKILKEAGTHLEIKAGLKARFNRLGKWVDERKTI